VRKVVAVELVSLDGVMEAPEEWAFSYTNDEMEAANAKGMAASDALLLGRVTYEQMATFWPEQPGGTPMVDYINSVQKLVVSTTLEEVGWNNSTPDQGRRRRRNCHAQAAAGQGHHDHRQRRPRAVAATNGTPQRTEAHGTSRGPRRR
jgi:dihydrofolate reductase